MKSLLVLVAVLLLIARAPAERPRELARLIQAHCVDCHEGLEAEGNLDLAETGFDLTNAENARRWTLVHDRLAKGEMPPPKKRQPSPEAKRTALAELRSALTRAAKEQSDVVLRRLNRREYQNTVRDLFATDVTVNGLPEDSSLDGFDNVGEGLAVSAEAMQAYLSAADQVLDAVFGPPTKPRFIRHETTLPDQKDWKGRPQLAGQYGKMFRRTKDGLVIFQSRYCPTSLVNFSRLRAPAGTYRGRMKVRAVNSDQPVTLRIYAGDTIVNRRERHLVGYFDAPKEWTWIEFEDRLVEPHGTFQPKCYGTEDIRKNADTWKGAGIEIADIVIEGPLEPWPPRSRAALLGNLDLSKATESDAKTIIDRLLPRAFRRPVRAGEGDEYLALFRNAMSRDRSFESAIRVSLKAVLCSPEFLFLDEPGSGRLDPHALASRLSYFLWSSLPDAELIKLARTGKLQEELSSQVERMLRDPKAAAFTKNFTGQWLSLRDLDFTEPDPKLYPEYDELLRISMAKETELFFQEALNRDLSVVNFVDSDFTFLNHRLAAHYFIDGIEGQNFRKVQLPAGSPRGGLLTQASILKVTANGTYTSPVLRGAWVLDRILGEPSSPPPDNVGSVEPDTRGASTIREQLAKHRNVASCAACHRRIDPPGFALENFDPIGGYRNKYRTMSRDGGHPGIKRAPFTWEWVRFRMGPLVDATGNMHTGEPFGDVREFKKLVARDPDQLTRNLARKLLTYALGRKVGFADRPTIGKIVAETRAKNHGFRSLIHAVVQSKAFQTP